MNEDLPSEYTVKRVEEVYSKFGAAQALAMLQVEDTLFKALHPDDKKHTDDYYNAVTKRLEEDKVLPEMSIAWAKGNMKAIAQPPGDSSSEQMKSFSQYDLWAFDQNDPALASFNAPMKLSIQRQYKSLKNEVDDDDNEITEDDLDARLERQNVASLKRNAAGLILGGGKQLFRMLDSASNGEEDGIISQNDLKRYLATYNLVTDDGKDIQAPDSPYSQRNYDAVHSLLTQWQAGKLDELDLFDPMHKWMHGDDYLTIKTLGKAAGIEAEDTDELFAKHGSKTKPSPATDRGESRTSDRKPEADSAAQRSQAPPASPVIPGDGPAAPARRPHNDSHSPSPAENPPECSRTSDYADISLTTTIGGKRLIEIAQVTLEARARLTGEDTSRRAVLEELNRIKKLNGYPSANLDGKAQITSTDLPRQWNNVRHGQVLRLYADDNDLQLAIIKGSTMPHKARQGG